MPRHCENAQKVAEWFEKNPKVNWVNYCGLKSNKKHALTEKYLPNGSCGVFAFGLKDIRVNYYSIKSPLQMLSARDFFD